MKSSKIDKIKKFSKNLLKSQLIGLADLDYFFYLTNQLILRIKISDQWMMIVIAMQLYRTKAIVNKNDNNNDDRFTYICNKVRYKNCAIKAFFPSNKHYRFAVKVS